MSYLPIPETPAEATFSDQVYRLETTDPVLGHQDGALGVSNEQAKRLIENDIYLKKHVDDIESGEGLGDNTIERTKLKIGVLPAGVPRNTVVNGPYTSGVRSLIGSSGTALTHGAFRVAFAKGFDAKGQVDYFAAISAANAQNVTPAGYYYAYAWLNESTGIADVRLTTIVPVYSPEAPASPVNNQFWYDMANEQMKQYNSGSASWTTVLAVFIGEARKLGGGTWTDILIYEYRRDTNLESGSTPAGTIAPFAGARVPDGWLLCDGQERNISAYPRLFGVIGTTFGGDTEGGYFQTPDLRGRTVVGIDSMASLAADRITGSWADSLGGASGSETHTLTAAQMPVHNHRAYGGTSMVTDGSAALAGSSVRGFAGHVNAAGLAYQNTAPVGGQKYIEDAGGTAGVTQAHNNVQPSIALNYIIKA